MQSGGHYCVSFETDTARACAAAAFVRAGLRADDKVVYLAHAGPERVPGSLAARRVNPDPHVASGRLVVHEAWRMRLSAKTDRVLDLLHGLLDEALGQGYSRLRLIQELSGLIGTALPAEALADLETAITSWMSGRPALALCQYDGRRYAPDQLAAAERPHTASLTAEPQHEDGLLRIQRTRLPPGLALIGEIDITNRAALADSLASLVDAGGDIHVDISELAFIDADAAELLIDTAADLRPAGRALVLDGPRHGLRRLLALSRDLPDNLVVVREP